MGESPCLMHSYSCAVPITNESDEGLWQENPIHALNQSISFGRFMTDSLDWEKRSAFTHKKYVEEAERYSRPGSVAQKKAFFEAQYKKKAAAKKATAEMVEQQAGNASESQTAHKQEAEKQKAANASESQTAHKQEAEKQKAGTGLVVDANVLNVEKDESARSKVEGAFVEQKVLVENSMRVGSLKNNEATDVVPDGLEQKENYMKIESLKSNTSIDKKEEDRDSLKKNLSNSSRMSEKCSTSVKAPTILEKHPSSVKRSERPACDSSDKPSKTVGRKWRFLSASCFASAGSRTERQDARRSKARETRNKTAVVPLLPGQSISQNPQRKRRTKQSFRKGAFGNPPNQQEPQMRKTFFAMENKRSNPQLVLPLQQLRCSTSSGEIILLSEK